MVVYWSWSRSIITIFWKARVRPGHEEAYDDPRHKQGSSNDNNPLPFHATDLTGNGTSYLVQCATISETRGVMRYVCHTISSCGAASIFNLPPLLMAPHSRKISSLCIIQLYCVQISIVIATQCGDIGTAASWPFIIVAFALSMLVS